MPALASAAGGDATPASVPAAGADPAAHGSHA